jgi:hypothetical protein
MRDLSSISHRIHTARRIMGGMGTPWKVLLGLVLVLPMTAYVGWSLVAAADAPTPHSPIIVEQRTQTPEPSQSPSDKPTEKPSGHKSERGDDHPGDDNTPEIITQSPDVFDDHGGDDNSGKGSGDDDSGGDDSSGKGSDDD